MMTTGPAIEENVQMPVVRVTKPTSKTVRPCHGTGKGPGLGNCGFIIVLELSELRFLNLKGGTGMPVACLSLRLLLKSKSDSESESVTDQARTRSDSEVVTPGLRLAWAVPPRPGTALQFFRQCHGLRLDCLKLPASRLPRRARAGQAGRGATPSPSQRPDLESSCRQNGSGPPGILTAYDRSEGRGGPLAFLKVGY
jgi:hypothetical protein